MVLTLTIQERRVMPTMQNRLALKVDSGAKPPVRDSKSSGSGSRDPAAARILAALAERHGGVVRWAEARGYRWRTVYRVIEIWGPRRDRAPWGGIGRQIMADLRADLGADVVPVPAGELR
jgi:hypothetical protein